MSAKVPESRHYEFVKSFSYCQASSIVFEAIKPKRCYFTIHYPSCIPLGRLKRELTGEPSSGDVPIVIQHYATDILMSLFYDRSFQMKNTFTSVALLVKKIAFFIANRV